MGQSQPWASGTSLGMSQGWTKAWACGPSLGDPWAGRAGLWGAGDQPCCGITGAGADSPGGLRWGPGPWAGGRASGGPGGDNQGHQCPQSLDINLVTTNMAYPVPRLDLSWSGFKWQNCEWDG